MKDYETLVCARLGSTWLTSGSVLWPATAPPSSSSVVVLVSSVLNPPGKGLARMSLQVLACAPVCLPSSFYFYFYFIILWWFLCFFIFTLSWISAAVRRAPVNHQTRRGGGGGHVNYKIQRERKLVAFEIRRFSAPDRPAHHTAKRWLLDM